MEWEDDWNMAYARVVLPGIEVHTAEAKAIALVEALKAVNHPERDTWKLLRGALLYVDGERRSLFSWGPKEYVPEPYYAQNDRLSRDISRMSQSNQTLDAQSIHDLQDAIGMSAVQPLRSKTQPKGAVGLTAEQLRDLLQKVRKSEYCRNHDLVDPITLLIATGLRRSELLGMRWVDFDGDARTLAVTGKVVRVAGDGLKRVDETKSAAGRRTVPLPLFAVAMLTARRLLPFLGEADVIFPSTAGTLRDPNNFGKEWRTVREELGVPEVTTHSFRKTVATLIDDDGLSARIGADHLGHNHVSMTQDRT